VENTRPIVEVYKEEVADEDVDLEGEEEEILHAEVESIAICMATTHTIAVCVKH